MALSNSPRTPRVCPALSRVALATFAACAALSTLSAHAQSGKEPVLPAVLVKPEAAAPDVSGFGDAPVREAPFSIKTFDVSNLREHGAARISDALLQDAAVSNSYNSPAYWDILSVRGFTLDNRYNYRRDGLPISAETMIALDNIERIELLKGTSGIQAGTSAPGGLANYVVKRPPAPGSADIRHVDFQIQSANSQLLAADLGGRFGTDAAWGYRLNVAHEKLKPATDNTNGQRSSVALAVEYKLSARTLLEVEVASSHRQQFGVNGYSLLGNALPAPVDPRHNLTAQPWSVPGVFDSNTGSVRVQHTLDSGWQWKLHYGAQRLRTDDRLAFAYGCTDTNFNYYADRYCPDGTFDLYDFRSDNERRLSDALLAELSGQWKTGDATHDVQLAVMRQRQLDRFPSLQAYNYVGTGSVAGGLTTGSDPSLTTSNVNRSEYSTEWSLKDRVRWGTQTAVWWGIRHTEFNRSSARNAPAPDTNYQASTGSMNTPWVGISSQWQGFQVYASHGQGVELFAAPNSPYYANAGQLLGVARSRQTEAGVRSPVTSNGWQWNAAAFQIERPLAYDFFGARVVDGKQVHRGIDTGAQWQNAQWLLGAQAQWLHARIEQAALNTSLNGTRPLNVPAFTLRANAQYRVAQVPGLRLSAAVSHEGSRHVLEDGSIALPAWTRLDAAAHYDTTLGQAKAQWTLGVDNVSDHRYWQESPKQFGHYYLYPGAPRTWRLALSLDL
jgi:iron complex outermembrane recepter protein